MRHAIVIGGSMAGLLAARVLADYSSESRSSIGTDSPQSASNVAEFHKDGILTRCLQAGATFWRNSFQAFARL